MFAILERVAVERLDLVSIFIEPLVTLYSHTGDLPVTSIPALHPKNQPRARKLLLHITAIFSH